MFILSKITGFLLDPFLWVVLLILSALLMRDTFLRKKRLLLAASLFLLFSNGLIISKLCLAWQPASREAAPGEHYDTGIVLGGYAGYETTEKKGYFNSNADRFLETARLYKTGHISRIIVSGGQAFQNPDGFLEAVFTRERLMDMGIPREDIIIEGKSRNTKENALFTKAILDSLHLGNRQLLITSAMHMPRAEKIFRNAGIPVATFPCAYVVLPRDGQWYFEQLMPRARAFDLWHVYLRELVGWIVAGDGH
jgi:uncharacterized SAM-binding protein YcdF (DUF218 family)